MTIPSTPRKAGPLLGNGVQTSWPFTFKVFADTDILVTVADILGVESELTLTSDYTVTLNSNQETSPGGAVTYLLPDGYTLVITGDIDYDQPLDLPSGGAFSPTALENELDRLTMQIQQLREAVNRAVRAPITSNASGYLPSPQSNTLIGWNESETAMQNFPLSEIATAIAFATYRYDTFTGDGTTTSFVLSADPVTLGNIDVSVDGQTYVPGVDHTLVGQNLVFTVAPADGVEILARYGQGMASGVSGDALDIAYQPAGVGAELTTVQDKLREFVSVFDFMSSAQVADVRSGTALIDVTSAIQAAITYAATRSLVGGTVYLPPGSYRVSSTIHTYGAGGVGQVALIGAGPYTTRLFPSGDFTVINDVSSYVETGGFSIEWPVTARASIPSTRVGVEFAAGTWQCSYATKQKITVAYAYRGFVLNDWTASALGTIYLIKLFALTAFRCADWGIHLNSKVGSTTTILEQCYVRGDDSTGTPAGKGIFVNNVDDVLFQDCAIDQCVDSWVRVQNASVFTAVNLAIEACKITSAGAAAVSIAASSAAINGMKTIACTYSTGGDARVIFQTSNTYNLTVSGYSEQAATIAGGTTRYKAVFNAAASHLYVLDGSIAPADVQDNGWFANAVYQGVRKTGSAAFAPTYGTWARGDIVKNGSPAVGSPKGWVCTVSGTPGTWVSEGNL